MENRKQILTWRCRPCDRWVAIEVQSAVSPKCPSCGTDKEPMRPGRDSLAARLMDPRWARNGSA